MEAIATFFLGIAAFFASYGLQAVVVFGAMLLIGLPLLGLLLLIRATWRRISPYEPPPFGAYPSLRDRLERL